MDPAQIAALIEQGLPDCQAQVSTDGQGHYLAVVVSGEFDGLRTLRRHRMVYDTLGTRVGQEIHALALKTYTPEEWRSAQA
jgi:acid stress-induced BolA-like protein IbaG/YrbA